MWYPGKAALRAGMVTGEEWNDTNIGNFSVAFGLDATANGNSSFAAGAWSRASGPSSAALVEGTATGTYATAIGPGASASGRLARAFGYNVNANSYGATAMGTFASSNGKTGVFVYGDNDNTFVRASRDNQFVVRAQHFWFGRTNDVSNPLGQFITTSTGAYLSTGGTWTNSSDASLKHDFRPVDGDAVLDRLARLPIRSWSYRSEADSVRHIGPTAQDFRAAFGLGDSDRAIATVDADGVALAAVKALERRTAEQALTVAALTKEAAALRAELEALRAELRRLHGKR
jgi:hypothetical protein